MRRQLFKQISQSRQVCCTWITGSAFPFGYRLMADTWSIRNTFLRHMTFQAFSSDDFPSVFSINFFSFRTGSLFRYFCNTWISKQIRYRTIPAIPGYTKIMIVIGIDIRFVMVLLYLYLMHQISVAPPPNTQPLQKAGISWTCSLCYSPISLQIFAPRFFSLRSSSE